jgi:outer membrane protein TolC
MNTLPALRRATSVALMSAAVAATSSETSIAQQPAVEQPAAEADTLRLDVLQQDALRRDPRGRELELLAAQSALRLRSIDAENLPSLGVNGQAQHQSDVATIPIALPGLTVPTPPRDTYDARLDARQRLFDPAVAGRRAVERAQLAESEARVRSALFALRQNVNDAYFTALALQSQLAEVETGVTDLEAQLRVAADRVKHGTALPSEAAIIEAELLRRRQSLDELSANRDASLAVLSDLTGRSISSTAALAIPDLSGEVARARSSLEGLRSRPEYEQFARTRDLLAKERVSVGARDMPRVSAFGRAGYGRPGLNPLARDPDSYWLAGVQLEWTPWTWGTTRRDREVLSLQQQIVEHEEAAFTESIGRSVVRDLATIDRLERALGEDDRIIALREQVLGEARVRFGEAVITSAEYVDRQTDVTAARVAHASHRVELALARARFLTSLGLEVR